MSLSSLETLELESVSITSPPLAPSVYTETPAASNLTRVGNRDDQSVPQRRPLYVLSAAGGEEGLSSALVSIAQQPVTMGAKIDENIHMAAGLLYATDKYLGEVIHRFQQREAYVLRMVFDMKMDRKASTTQISSTLRRPIGLGLREFRAFQECLRLSQAALKKTTDSTNPI